MNRLISRDRGNSRSLRYFKVGTKRSDLTIYKVTVHLLNPYWDKRKDGFHGILDIDRGIYTMGECIDDRLPVARL